MGHELPAGYYDELQDYADRLVELGLQVLPARECIVTRDRYTGFEEFREWQESGNPNDDDPEDLRFGLEGDEACGSWSSDGSRFQGFFPIYIRENGGWYIRSRRHLDNPKDIDDQIERAKWYNIPMGIAASTFTYGSVAYKSSSIPNAILAGPHRMIEDLGLGTSGMIETYEGLAWKYASIDVRDEPLKTLFQSRDVARFGLGGSGIQRGTIYKHGVFPAYPSFVFGKQVQLLGKSEHQLFVLSKPAVAGMHFNVNNLGQDFVDADVFDEIAEEDDDLAPEFEDWDDWDESYEMHWCPSPDEEDQLFEQTVKAYEEAVTQSRNVSGEGLASERGNGKLPSSTEVSISLFELFPEPLASALHTIKDPLPYDDVSVAMAFITGAASMLPLGTKIMGVKATDFTVPPNFYTAIVAKSGRKKTSLGKLFVKGPAADVEMMLARQNQNMMRKWEEHSRGCKKEDRLPKPVPINIRFNDYTGEALVANLNRLDEVSRSALLYREELAAVFKSQNQYRSGRGSDEEQLLELYDGDPHVSLRLSASDRSYQRAAVNIYGSIQPGVLTGQLKNGDDNGAWARFFFVPMADIAKKLPTKVDPAQIQKLQAAKKNLCDVFNSLYALGMATYELGESATELFAEYEFQKQHDARTARLSAQASVYGKSAGKVLRLSGILHILSNFADRSQLMKPIGVEHLQIAIRLVDYLDAWALACHASVLGTPTAQVSAFTKRIHEIALKTKKQMSWTDIRNLMSSTERGGKKKQDAEASMRELVALGVGEIVAGPRGGLCYRALKPLPK